MAVRNSISSGHYILSTIHADKASSIPNRMYSLLETNQDIDQFLKTIHRYVQLGVHIKGYYSTKYNAFHREVAEVVEFYVTDDNKAEYKILYKKTLDGEETTANPSKYLISYLESQGVIMPQDILVKEEFTSLENNDIINKDKVGEFIVDNSLYTESQSTSSNPVSSTVNTQNQSITPNQVSGTVPNTNMVESPNNNIPNIYATASSAPSSINLTNINNNQNIS